MWFFTLQTRKLSLQEGKNQPCQDISQYFPYFQVTNSITSFWLTKAMLIVYLFQQYRNIHPLCLFSFSLSVENTVGLDFQVNNISSLSFHAFLLNISCLPISSINLISSFLKLTYISICSRVRDIILLPHFCYYKATIISLLHTICT